MTLRKKKHDSARQSFMNWFIHEILSHKRCKSTQCGEKHSLHMCALVYTCDSTTHE